MASTGGVLVDDIVLEVLRKSQLEAYQDKFVFVFNVRRFDHFSHVRDKDMQDIGMQQPQIRQLREQILKMSREMWNRSDPKQVYVAGDQSTQNQSAIDEKAFIPNEQIKLFEQLGEGSFAVVRRRTWARSNGQKTSEPILSTEVLQPTRVPSAASTPKPVSQPVPTPQPVRNPSPPVVQTRLAEKKPANPLAQSTNVPLFNITNSNMYPQLNNYPNYGNGYQPYGYGMNYNSGYPGVQGYNPYMSGMGQLALTNQAVNSLPPLVPSENRFSGSAQPLDESAINELLGAQNRQEASRVTPSAPVATPSAPSAPSTSYQNDLSMADRMEVLYKEADFTERGNCDTMVTHCKGDTELALKLLKQNHLMAIGVANTPDQARRALEARQYDLSAAANLLLG